MAFIPADVHRQDFKKKFWGGFDPGDVRQHIDQLGAEMVKLQEENDKLRRLTEEMRQEQKTYVRRLGEIDEVRDLIRQNAQAYEEQTKLEATANARMIVDEAQRQAHAIQQQADEHRKNVIHAIEADSQKLRLTTAEEIIKLEQQFVLTEQECDKLIAQLESTATTLMQRIGELRNLRTSLISRKAFEKANEWAYHQQTIYAAPVMPSKSTVSPPRPPQPLPIVRDADMSQKLDRLEAKTHEIVHKIQNGQPKTTDAPKSPLYGLVGPDSEEIINDNLLAHLVAPK